MVRYRAMYWQLHSPNILEPLEASEWGGIMVLMFFLGKVYFCVLCCGVCVGKNEMLLFFCGDVMTHRW
jgi:hypothetical protein